MLTDLGVRSCLFLKGDMLIDSTLLSGDAIFRVDTIACPFILLSPIPNIGSP